MPKTPPRRAGSRSTCPVACSLDLIGDRWTLLIVRDLLRGLSRYNEFLESGERIPTNILSERLRRLERAGLVSRQRYQDRPPRYAYHLTPAGRSLGPVVRALATWGSQRAAGGRPTASGG